MKKILALLVAILPLSVLAQWSVVPSVALGGTMLHNDFENEFSTKSKLGYDVSSVVRYTFNDFFVSSGVGYQSLSVGTDFKKLNGSGDAEFSYKNVYFPLSVGFAYKKIAVYPIIEVGITVGTTVDAVNALQVDRLRGLATEENVGTNSWVLSYFASAGAGYAFSKHISAELKFHFSDSGELDDGNPFFSGTKVTTWRLLGGKLSLAYTF